MEAEDDEGDGEGDGGAAGGGGGAQEVTEDSPAEEGAETADNSRVKRDELVAAAKEAENCGLDEEGEGRMDEGEVAIGELALGNA